MNGTEKQAEWATRIRDQARKDLASWGSLYQVGRSLKDRHSANWQDLEAHILHRLGSPAKALAWLQATIDRGVEEALGVESAAQWIEAEKSGNLIKTLHGAVVLHVLEEARRFDDRPMEAP